MRLHLPPGRRVGMYLLATLCMLVASASLSAQSRPVGHLRAINRASLSAKALNASAQGSCPSLFEELRLRAAGKLTADAKSNGCQMQRSAASQSRLAAAQSSAQGGWKVEPSASPATAPEATEGGGFSGFLTLDSYPTEPTVVSYVNTLVTLDGDFLHRGRKDLFTIDSKAQTHLLANDGSGAFAKPISSDVSVSGAYSTSYNSALVYDYDKDGYPDVLAMDSSNFDIAYLHNNHDGSFTLAKSIALPSWQPASMMLGDVNGDGQMDLLVFVAKDVYQSDGSVSTTLRALAYLGDGTGDFASTPVETDYDVSGGEVMVPDRGLILGSCSGKPCLYFEMISTWSHGIYGATAVAVGLNGDGTFALDPYAVVDFTSNNIYTHTSNSGLSIADLNGDGAPDLTMSFNDGYIYTALGNADGSFQSVRAANPSFSVYPLSWAVKDVDGDGYPDFVVKDFNTFEVLPGDGSGLFNKAKKYYTVFNSSNGGSSTAPGFNFVFDDINGDGVDDAIYVDGTSNGYQRANVLMGQGAGEFHGPVALPSNNLFGVDPGAYYGEQMFDAKGDGKSEIFLLDVHDPGVVMAADDGKGGLTMTRALSAKHEGFMTGEILGAYDFNNDGVKDLLLYSYTPIDSYNYSYSFAVALGKGDGTFAEPTQMDLGGVSLTSNPRFVAIGDVNGDGAADLVAAVGGGYSSLPATLLTFLGKGDGSFQTATSMAYGNSFSFAGIALADFNGDGKLDLLVSDDGVSGSTAPSLNILLGDGSGSFSASRSLNVESGLQLRNVLVGDLNGDGAPDLALLSAGQTSGYSVANVNRGALIYMNKGDGSFVNSAAYEIGSIPGSGLLVDANGDGKLDMIFGVDYPWDAATTETSGLQLLLGHGDGSFGAPSNLNAPASVTYLAAGDLNGDGAVDLMTFSNYLGSVAVLRNQSGTTMTLSSDVASIASGDSVNLTAVVSAAVDHRPTPTGAVKFMFGSKTLGEAPLNGGSAHLRVDSLPVGSDAVKAVYEGDANYSANYSGAVASIKVAEAQTPTPDFTLGADASSLSLARGASSASSISLSANAGFSGAVTLSAANLPAGLTVQFAQTTVTLQPGKTVAVSYFVSSSASKTSAALRGGSLTFALFLPLLGAVLGLTGGRRRRRALVLGLSLLALTTLALLSGCGSGSPTRVAAKGDYSIVLQAKPSVSGVAAKAVTVNVHVD